MIYERPIDEVNVGDSIQCYGDKSRSMMLPTAWFERADQHDISHLDMPNHWSYDIYNEYITFYRAMTWHHPGRIQSISTTLTTTNYKEMKQQQHIYIQVIL